MVKIRPFHGRTPMRRSAPWAAQIRRSSRNLRCIWIRMEAIEQLGWAGKLEWSSLQTYDILSANFT